MSINSSIFPPGFQESHLLPVLPNNAVSSLPSARKPLKLSSQSFSGFHQPADYFSLVCIHCLGFMYTEWNSRCTFKKIQMSLIFLPYTSTLFFPFSVSISWCPVFHIDGTKDDSRELLISLSKCRGPITSSWYQSSQVSGCICQGA